MKLRSLRTGLPAVKEFGEPPTELEFDRFDDITTDGGQPEGKGTGQPPAEEVNEDGKGEGGAEDGESESNPRKETKPPAVDEYQWQWKVSDPGPLLVVPY